MTKVTETVNRQKGNPSSGVSLPLLKPAFLGNLEPITGESQTAGSAPHAEGLSPDLPLRQLERTL